MSAGVAGASRRLPARGRLARFAGPLVFLWVLLAARAEALGDQTGVVGRSQVEARVGSAWPTRISSGWVPLQLELSNRGDRRRSVRIEASSRDSWARRDLYQEVVLEPGEGVALELLVPAGGEWSSPWSLFLQVDGEKLGFSNVASGGAGSGYRNVLTVGPAPVPESEVLRWIELSSTSSGGGRIHISGGGFLGPLSMPASRSSGPDNVQIAYAVFERLPASAAAYTSLDTVLLDGRDELPPEAKLEPLMAWVRNGGSLIVVGAGAFQQASTRPSFAPWLEPRFEGAGGGSDLRIFACGMGSIRFHGADAWLDDDTLLALVCEQARGLHSMAPRGSQPSRTSRKRPVIPGLDSLPYRSFAQLLVVFALVIGPLNFAWVRRRKRPVLLLVTIPAIAVVSSVLLLAYGILFQGLEVKTASCTASLLDQRLHRSASIERRLLFAGMAPSDGLRPGPGTSVHVVREDAMSQQRQSLVLRRDGGLLLQADYLPSRMATEQVLCTERASRARLDVERTGDGYSVVNNLGTRIETLIARAGDGGYHELPGPLEPGARGELVPKEHGGAVARGMLSVPFDVSPALHGRPNPERLPAATYVASLATSPFRDDCGIEMSEKSGQHTLLGIWGLDEEAWR